MPEFQYWWTLAGAFLAFSTFVTSYIGIKGVEVVISRRRYWFVWACSAIVALGAWYLNAKQTADAAQDKRDLLAALNRSDPKPSVTLPNDAPAWVATAYKEIGQSEIPGVEENPRILVLIARMQMRFFLTILLVLSFNAALAAPPEIQIPWKGDYAHNSSARD
jgi:hypothetical protein